MSVINHTIDRFPESINRYYFGAWLSGLIDGEGCFTLRTDRKRDGSFSCGCGTFSIQLRGDDIDILKLIHDYWMVGSLYGIKRTKNLQVKYCVFRIAELAKVVIPHFEKYPLMAKKRMDFEIWSDAIMIAYSSAINGKYVTKNRKWPSESAAEFEKLCRKLKGVREYRGDT